MEALRKNQMEMLGIKGTREDMKNAISRLINRHDILKEKISELKNREGEIKQTKTQREKHKEKIVTKAEQNIQELRTIPNYITCA